MFLLSLKYHLNHTGGEVGKNVIYFFCTETKNIINSILTMHSDAGLMTGYLFSRSQ